MTTHSAGARHAEDNRPARPQSAQELLRLDPNVWPRNTVRDQSGVACIAGVPLTELAHEYGTPLFVVDEDDFRSRCQEIAAAFGGGHNVYYAAKAFLCSEIARWVEEEGLSSMWPPAGSWPSHCTLIFLQNESPCTATTSLLRS
ncbi:hypothetical protein NIIDMKKI_18220 [Mycobacterium kansasii]|uniref:Diaminopimelate decarboxylase n=1 Tax=Mycobacterium kansasii TaxID=1768 RepID=A0A7G1I6J0_MYCKA|nr:hypothetical protein NIIDMKKI_18220 [Mycobacterium kansasii]